MAAQLIFNVETELILTLPVTLGILLSMFLFPFETLENSHIIMALGHYTFILIGAKGATKQNTPCCAHTSSEHNAFKYQSTLF